jgi:hypothetical protein
VGRAGAQAQVQVQGQAEAQDLAQAPWRCRCAGREYLEQFQIPQNGRPRDVSQIKHTGTPHDRVLERKTPAEELCIGQSPNGARRIFKEIAPGGRPGEFASNLVSAVVLNGLDRESSTRDGGDDDCQRRDEGENPHGMRLSRKECGGVEGVWGRRKYEKREKRKRSLGRGSQKDPSFILDWYRLDSQR